MSVKGFIFDMDGTITAPYFDFAKIKDEAGIGDVDMLDYLRYATGEEYERIQRILLRFEMAGVRDAKSTIAGSVAGRAGKRATQCAGGIHAQRESIGRSAGAG